jgi:hypothetical protein
MRRDWRLPLAGGLLVLLVLLATGIRPAALPFNPGARFSDAATSHFPAALFLRESVLERGELPLGRETIMAGQPFMANPLNKTAYPLQWLALIFPPALHLNVMILLHLALAGWGMWTWTRALGLRPEAAAVSALVYVLAPRMIGHTGAGHVDLVYALAWFPWLMWAVHALLRANPPLWQPVLRLALVAALVFLSDVRLSLFAFGAAAWYALHLILEPIIWRGASWTTRTMPVTRTTQASSLQTGEVVGAQHAVPLPNVTDADDIGAVRESPLPGGRGELRSYLGGLLFSTVVFVPLVLSVIVPLWLWQPYLSRASLTPQEAAAFSLEPGLLLGLFLPQHEGNIEFLTYVGWSVLILATIAVIMQPRRLAFWVTMTAVAAWYALGANGLLWSALTSVFPFLLWFRVPARAWFIVALIVPLLAGYGVQSLLPWLEQPARKALNRARLIAAVGMIGLLACGGFTLLMLPALPSSVGVTILLGGGGTALILLLALSGRLRGERLVWGLLLVIALDLGWTGLRWLEWRGEAQWLDPHRPLAELLVELGADRIYSPSYSLPQEAAAVYDLKLFGGVDPFQLQFVVDAIREASGVDFDGYSVVQPPLVGVEGDDLSTANRAVVPDTERLADWSVSHVIAYYPIAHDRLRLIDEIDGVYVYANLDYETAAPDPAQRPAGELDAETAAALNRPLPPLLVLSFAGFACGLALLWIGRTASR